MNLFMLCEKPVPQAFRAIPAPFAIRPCRADETALWTKVCTETVEDIPCAQEYIDEVYAPADPLFYRRILFACDENDRPVGACMLWKAYGCMDTVHWLRVLPEYEGRGIGRALLGACLSSSQGPVLLHTQEYNQRAIALYHSFGFRFVTDPVIGRRRNDLADALPLLRRTLPESIFAETLSAPQAFLLAAQGKRTEF